MSHQVRSVVAVSARIAGGVDSPEGDGAFERGGVERCEFDVFGCGEHRREEGELADQFAAVGGEILRIDRQVEVELGQ